MKRADTVFLDRDGVINIKLKDRYVQSFSEFQFIDSFQSFYNNNQISKFKPDIVHETYYSTRLKKKNYLKIITVYD